MGRVLGTGKLENHTTTSLPTDQEYSHGYAYLYDFRSHLEGVFALKNREGKGSSDHRYASPSPLKLAANLGRNAVFQIGKSAASLELTRVMPYCFFYDHSKQTSLR